MVKEDVRHEVLVEPVNDLRFKDWLADFLWSRMLVDLILSTRLLYHSSSLRYHSV